MAIFEEVRLGWKGSEYVIPPNGVMGCIACVEEILTFGDLHEIVMRGRRPLARLAQAYGAMLRYAGARVSDDEVYAEMFNVKEGATTAQQVQATVEALMVLMIPPETMARAEEASKKTGKQEGAEGQGSS